MRWVVVLGRTSQYGGAYGVCSVWCWQGVGTFIRVLPSVCSRCTRNATSALLLEPHKLCSCPTLLLDVHFDCRTFNFSSFGVCHCVNVVCGTRDSVESLTEWMLASQMSPRTSSVGCLRTVLFCCVFTWHCPVFSLRKTKKEEKKQPGAFLPVWGSGRFLAFVFDCRPVLMAVLNFRRCSAAFTGLNLRLWRTRFHRCPGLFTFSFFVRQMRCARDIFQQNEAIQWFSEKNCGAFYGWSYHRSKFMSTLLLIIGFERYGRHVARIQLQFESSACLFYRAQCLSLSLGFALLDACNDELHWHKWF